MSLGAPKRKLSRKIPQIVKGNEHAIFAALLKQSGIPDPQTEVRFCAERRWRFDYAFYRNVVSDPARSRKVAVEVEGGAFTRGRHTRGKGFIADMEKYNEAAIRGWIVLRVTPSQLCTTDTIDLIRRALSLT